jgi:hypothetical protein
LTLPNDHDRIREMIKRLDELQRESQAIRSRIEQVAARSPEFPRRDDASEFFAGCAPRSSSDDSSPTD